MRFFLDWILPVALFLAFLSLTHFIVSLECCSPGWYSNGKKVSFPLGERVESPKEMVLTTEFESSGERLFLVLPRLGLSNLIVEFNGRRILQIGGDGKNVRMWTYTFSVPLDAEKGKNTVVLKTRLLYDYRMNWPPYISSDPWKAVLMSNLVFSEFPKAAFGMILLLGIFSMVLPSSFKRFGNVALGISLILMSFYLLDFAYFPLVLSDEAFLTMRKILYSLPYMAFGFFYIGVNEAIIGRRPGMVIPVILIGLGASILFLPFNVARSLTFALSPLALFTVTVLLIFILSERSVPSGPFLFLGLTVYHHTFSAAFNFPNPSLLSYGVVYASAAVWRHLYEEYKRLNLGLESERRRAFLDPLTSAYNRRFLEKGIFNADGTVVFVDLDDFKRYNDLHGHEAGDEILKRFTEVARESLRKSDIVVRFGGDEFVIILPECDEKRAYEITERFRRNFVARTGIDFSFGMARIGGRIWNAVRVADRRMYEMKRSKRSSD